MGRFYPSGGQLVLEDGARRVWSTDGKPVNLLPEANWLTVPVTFAFPDFIKRNAYLFDIEINELTDVTTTSCMSVSTILPGEWGFDKAAPRTIADIGLGSVPIGVNYIDARVKLDRTNAPDDAFGFAIARVLANEWSAGPGNSFQCEKVPGLLSRGFDVRLSGISVLLRRYQTVTANSNGIDWVPGNEVYNGGGGKNEGWTYGGGSDAQNAHLMSIIQAKGPGGNVNKERGGSNACSLVDTKDYSSTWSGTIVVRPGYIAA